MHAEVFILNNQPPLREVTRHTLLLGMHRLKSKLYSAILLREKLLQHTTSISQISSKNDMVVHLQIRLTKKSQLTNKRLKERVVRKRGKLEWFLLDWKFF